MEKDKLLSRASMRNPIISFSRVTSIMSFVALVINVLVFLFLKQLGDSELISFEDSFIRIGMSLIMFGCFYSIYRSKSTRMRTRFNKYEEIPALIEKLSPITLVRGISSIRYTYEYNGISYNGINSISDFNGDAKRLKIGGQIKILINIDNPSETLISDLCLIR